MCQHFVVSDDKKCVSIIKIYHHHHYHHELSRVRPCRPVSASSNSLFKCHPSRLRPFGLQFGIIFNILLLFITLLKFIYLANLILLNVRDDHTPPSSAEVKKELSYTSTHPMGLPGPVIGFPLNVSNKH
jgi:hypothetical protein